MGTRFLCLGLAAVMLAACSANRQPNQATASRGNAIVVRGSELSGNFLESLAVHVPNMHVTRPRPSRANSSQCPFITFRASRSQQGQPDVYVDNTLMLDTCILDQISSVDVDSVEVYTSGLTMRTGMRNNPYGVILIFRRRG